MTPMAIFIPVVISLLCPPIPLLLRLPSLVNHRPAPPINTPSARTLDRIKPVEKPNSKSDCGPEYSLPQSNLPRRFLNMRNFPYCFCHDHPLWKLVDRDNLRCDYFFPSPLTAIRGYVTQNPTFVTQERTRWVRTQDCSTL